MDINNKKKRVIEIPATSLNIGNVSNAINSALKSDVDLVFLKLSSNAFPNRTQDLPNDLRRILMTNPKVKGIWDDQIQDINLEDYIEYGSLQLKNFPGGEWLKRAYDYLVSEKHCCFLKIIIPCWGVESEIGKMLDSIFNQSFRDFHVVCVEDCSPDKTLEVLQSYEMRYQGKMTIIRNQKNIGAGESRNRGFYHTLTSIPSEYVWVVDGDDYLADNLVFQKIYDFVSQNPGLDIINVGWTCKGEYSISRIGWPVGLPGRVIRPWVYIPGLGKNIPFGNDVYSHFIMFDQVPGNKIGFLDYNCYVYPKPGRHWNGQEKNMNVPVELGKALMTHKFRKSIVVDELMKGRAGTGQWIKRHFPDFDIKMDTESRRKVSILMASFPYRKKWMLQCIEQLMPQCDNFYLWLNEYTKVPSELNKFDKSKLHITLGNVNLKENGRYLFLTGECKNDYCFICDDDINYPPDYVENTLKCFERNGDDVVLAYYIHSNNSFVAEHAEDTLENIRMSNLNFVPIEHYRFGLGTAAFVPSITNFRITNEELTANYDIEMLIGEQCSERGIKVLSPARPKNFVTFIKNTKQGSQIDKYALHLTGARERTKFTYDYLQMKR